MRNPSRWWPAVPALAALFALGGTAPLWASGTSLRFQGNGTGDIDRVKIPLDAPARPVDVSGDFTIDWWMKASAADNTAAGCTPGPIGNDGWITGNIVFDRDVFGAADVGDYGISLRGGRVAFGVAVGGSGETLCGSIDVADGAWHHVAVTRSAAGGDLAIFVDGAPDGAATGPTGSIDYRDGRATSFPDSDPFLVIGAEKHDAGAAFPSYDGWIDEVRVSTSVRYTAAFTRPALPFVRDALTAALYHFDEGYGDVLVDVSGASGGPSNGAIRVGGSPAGPTWSTDTPPLASSDLLTILTLTDGLASPVGLAAPHDGSNRLFVVEQGGLIRIWTGSTLLATPFLDVSNRISPGNERGLLALAFHPAYRSNGLFYIYYTRSDDPGTGEDETGDIVLARYQVSADANVADPATATTLLTIEHSSQANHNGGQLAFGRDGYLYISTGDGGGGGDPFENGQNRNTLLGKLLRIDVDGGAPYAIPPSNPFVGVAGTRPEVWAYGLRNPFRFSFDRLTGAKFIGDVGQSTREEVSFEPAAASGSNFGWDVLEGTFCHEDNPAGSCAALLAGGSSRPIMEYGRGEGTTVTGGYVFRGKPFGSLTGAYVFGDFGSGALWRATPDAAGTWTRTPLPSQPPFTLATFGEDERGSLFFVNRGAGTLRQLVAHTFTDLLPPHFAWPFVESIYAARLTAGCDIGLFCPDSATTREQMAIFLLRGQEGPVYTPPTCTTPPFDDVPCGGLFSAWIAELFRRGITAGCGGGNYCPGDPVTREQMAIFLLRSLEGPSYTPPACTTPTFVDVPCSSGYAPFIEELARRGITAGCGSGSYCPTSSVTRGQMAVFLTRAFDIP